MPLYNFYVGVNGFYEGLVAIMIQVIENYLKKHEITVADVAEAAVISESTLRTVFSQLVEEWTIVKSKRFSFFTFPINNGGEK